MKSQVLRVAYLFCVALFLINSGCGVRFAAPPQAMLDAEGRINKKESFVKRVYYGTTRIDKGNSEINNIDRYDTGNKITSKVIKYGYVDVRIPYIKKIGTTDGMSIVIISPDTGWSEFKDKISSDDLLIYIHGFNTSFNDAAVRCAQLAHDLNYHGTSIFYSWPAGKAGPVGYPTDRKRANENIVLLADFIEQIAGQTNKKIHIVAHSMGSIILANSLVEVNNRIAKDNSILAARRKHGNRVFNQIVFAASDIEKNDFTTIFNQNNLKELANGYTLYSTDKDYVLIESRVINYYIDHSGIPRLGDSSDSFVTISGIDTIDGRLEAGPQVFGHSYYAEDKGFVTDLFLLFNYEIKPERRLLLNVKDKTNQQLWFLRP